MSVKAWGWGRERQNLDLLTTSLKDESLIDSHGVSTLYVTPTVRHVTVLTKLDKYPPFVFAFGLVVFSSLRTKRSINNAR